MAVGVWRAKPLLRGFVFGGEVRKVGEGYIKVALIIQGVGEGLDIGSLVGWGIGCRL